MSHAPIPTIEFDRAELLAAEKESLGLFVSEHPLKPLRAALNARVDCSLAELAKKRDGDWVTVGGMITAIKRVRTKKGDPMTFATLDDLDGSVEMLVFGRALGSSEDALDPDSVVLVRGRVDHRDREKTCVVAQEIEPFAPGEDELREAAELEAKRVKMPRLLRLRLLATALPDGVLGDLKEILAGFPGECEVLIELQTSAGQRRLRLGAEFRVRRSAGLHAELVHLLGDALVSDRAGDHSPPPSADEPVADTTVAMRPEAAAASA